MRCFILFILTMILFLPIGCSAIVNQAKCEINVKQGNVDIPSETGYFNFGNLPINSSQNIGFIIQNTGYGTLILSGQTTISISGKDVTDFIVSALFTDKVILAHSSTTFTIQFSPKSLGEKTATITIENNDRDENPYIFVVIGTCISRAPEIHVRQQNQDIMSITGEYDFGNIAVDKTSENIIFTIENKGNENLLLTGIMLSGANADMFEVIKQDLSSMIAPQDSGNFMIIFAPTSAGIKSAKISILNNDSDENPYQFKISGTAIAAPDIVVKQESTILINGTGKYIFDDTLINYSSAEVTFTIENCGKAVLLLNDPQELVKIDGNDSSMYSVNLASTDDIIFPGKSTTFGIIFSPSAINLRTAVVSITNNVSNSNPYTFQIEGTCVASEINVRQGINGIPNNTGSYDYGYVGVGFPSLEITFTIDSNGSGDLILTGSPKISIFGTDSAMFIANETSTLSRIPNGSSTTFTIKFNPTSAGNKTASVSIANSDLDENPYIFNVVGSAYIVGSGVAIGWIGSNKTGWNTYNSSSSTGGYQGFYSPNATHVDSSGYIYVCDRQNHRVCKWDASGNAIGWIGGGSNGWQTSWAPSKDDDYQSFDSPSSVFVDQSGNIYIADQENNRICKWDASGNAIGWIGGGNNGWQTGNAPSSGNDLNAFNKPVAICVDSTGYIYVADRINHRISKWDSSGNAIGWIGGGSNGWKTGSAPSYGTDYQSFQYARWVCLDSSGNIYVSDESNRRISKWTNSGTAIGWIGGGSDGWKTGTAPSEDGFDYQSFKIPSCVFVNSNGDIFVADSNNQRVCKWDSSGTALGWIGGGSNGWKYGKAPAYGNDYQSFRYAFGLCGDSLGYLYVADGSNNRVCKWKD